VSTPVDSMVTAVQARVGEVARALRAHAGGLELRSVSAGGVVRVRFVGACAGCPLRPLTLAATVRPRLGELPGVTGVEDEGGRISLEAQERLRAIGAAPRGVLS